MSSTFGRIADLPVSIESYRLERHELFYSPEITRVCTVIRLEGAGHEGAGEDVGYEAADHDALRAAGAVQPLAGAWTVASFSAHLDGLKLFPADPEWLAFVDYRRWAFESAALDLGLRQNGLSLAAALGRTPQPVTFVTSRRLPEPASAAPIEQLAVARPELGFKLDPTPDWDDEVIAALVAVGRVRVLDLKGHYEGSIVDTGADPDLYRRVIAAFPGAWIEDPRVTDATAGVLADVWPRVSWDAPIHSVADIAALTHPPGAINVKPSRFGRIERLFAAYDHLAERGIPAYGGGQAELSLGRGQIQYLASLFHPDAPNDVAPSVYNRPELPTDPPASPLPAPPADRPGFRWDDAPGMETGGVTGS